MANGEQRGSAPAVRSFDELSREQIAIYARELNEHFRKERGLRVSVQERDRQLEQRAREVTALNHLLQQHLLEWYKVAQEYREVLAGIREMLREGSISDAQREEMGALIDRVVAEPRPEDRSTCSKTRASPAHAMRWDGRTRCAPTGSRRCVREARPAPRGRSVTPLRACRPRPPRCRRPRAASAAAGAAPTPRRPAMP